MYVFFLAQFSSLDGDVGKGDHCADLGLEFASCDIDERAMNELNSGLTDFEVRQICFYPVLTYLFLSVMRIK